MKSYAVKVGDYYITDLYPIGVSENIVEAKIYNKLGSARSLKTKYSKRLLEEANQYMTNSRYFAFPKIEVFKLVSEGFTK